MAGIDRQEAEALIVVGDRVLIKMDKGEERTETGLVLPETATSKRSVKSGRVVVVGPGTAVAAPTDNDDEPWKTPSDEPKYVPMQARVGDMAMFLKDSAFEVRYKGEDYLVVPQGGILLLLREDADTDLPI